MSELAQRNASHALEELVCLARDGDSERTRLAAIKEILDRVQGCSTAPLADGSDIRHVLVDDGYED